MTIDSEEFGSVLKRVHGMLLDRVEAAKQARDLYGGEEREREHVEAAKDVFVLVHMIELVQHLSEETGELRDVIAAMGVGEQGNGMPALFASRKTDFLN